MTASLPLVFVFLRRPDPGKTKTRLARDLGDAEAAALYRAMAEIVVDQLRPHASLSFDVCLYTTPSGSAADIRSWLLPTGEESGFFVEEQPEGDLTDRLAHAGRLASEQGRPAVAFIGSDCPHFFATDVIDAFQLLVQGEYAVLAPAEDGGFWMLALEETPDAVFDGVPWSSDSTCEAIRVNLERLVGSPRLYDRRSDIDEREDLEKLPRSVRERLVLRARRLGVTAWPAPSDEDQS